MTTTARRWAILAAALVVLSAVALTVIASTAAVPSVLRDPLWSFAQPGTTVWWLTLGGPFRTGPSAPAEIAFASIANAASWLVVAWMLRAATRWVRRSIRARRR